MKQVTGHYERVRYNLVISQLMTLTTAIQRGLEAGDRPSSLGEAAEMLVLTLAPMAPHISEELWREAFGHPATVTIAPWPAWDDQLAREDEVVMVVQVDGRVRDRITVPADTGEDRCRELALASERARHALSGREIERVIVRAPRLVNIVARR